jgi:hypothetical protein
MCIAIVKPSGKSLGKDALKICFDANDDGAGFAYVNTDHLGVSTLKTYKSLSFESFWVKFERAQRFNPESNFLIHFRIKTHGKLNKNCCHPFLVNKELAFIHNGVIVGLTHSAEESDTMMFNKEILKTLPVGWEKCKTTLKLIGSFIGYSKIALLSKDNSYTIINESKGTWDDGIWYSNTSYKKPAYVRSTVTPPAVQHKPHVYVGGKSQGTYSMGFTMETCAWCDSPERIRDMFHYTANGFEVVSVCSDCRNYLLVNSIVDAKDEMKLGEFLKKKDSLIQSPLSTIVSDDDFYCGERLMV